MMGDREALNVTKLIGMSCCCCLNIICSYLCPPIDAVLNSILDGPGESIAFI
jgi:hypothetical protein